MRKNQFNNIVLILFFLSLSGSYISFLVFESHKLQVSLLNEFNSNKYQSNTFQKFQLLNKDFPNLTATGIPMYPLLAKYYLVFGKPYEALEILNNNFDSNPYMNFSDALKADIFLSLKVIDSALYYSEKAFKNKPGNIIHYNLFQQSLLIKKDIDRIYETFDEYKYKNQHTWKVFLATIFKFKEYRDRAIPYAKQARILFKGNTDIELLSDYILIGEENAKKAVKLSLEGEKYFDQKKYELAALKFEESSKYNTTLYANYENAALSRLLNKEPEKSIELINKIIDTLNPKSGKSEYILAKSLYELDSLNMKVKICDLLYVSQKRKYPNAMQFISNFCNKN